MSDKSAEWHAERRKGIGGSDANVIMGGNEEAIYNLWLEKRGEREPDDLSWVLPVQIGIVTEALNLRWLAHVSGLEIVADGKAHICKEIPFMRCIPDGLTSDTMVEAKHVGAFQDMDKIVQKYMPQSHHNMICTARKKCILSVFKGTMDHYWYDITLDEFYAADLMERERAFWDCVQSGKPPVDMPAIEPPVPPEKWRSVSFDGNNAWGSNAADWLANKKAAKTFETAAKNIKALIEPDVGKATGYGIICTRNKAGLSIKEFSE